MAPPISVNTIISFGRPSVNLPIASRKLLYTCGRGCVGQRTLCRTAPEYPSAITSHSAPSIYRQCTTSALPSLSKSHTTPGGSKPDRSLAYASGAVHDHSLLPEWSYTWVEKLRSSTMKSVRPSPVTSPNFTAPAGGMSYDRISFTSGCSWYDMISASVSVLSGDSTMTSNNAPRLTRVIFTEASPSVRSNPPPLFQVTLSCPKAVSVTLSSTATRNELPSRPILRTNK